MHRSKFKECLLISFLEEKICYVFFSDFFFFFEYILKGFYTTYEYILYACYITYEYILKDCNNGFYNYIS